MRKRILARGYVFALAVLLLLIAPITPALATLSMPFADVRANNWFYTYVQFMHSNGIMQGTSGNTFSPNATFSRGQIIATLFRIHHGRTENTSDNRTNNFNDVSMSAWYAPYVTWAILLISTAGQLRTMRLTFPHRPRKSTSARRRLISCTLHSIPCRKSSAGGYTHTLSWV